LQDLREEIDKILKRGDPSWQDQAEVACALGLAFGELGEFEKAVGHLDNAVKAKKAELSVRALEQRANFKSRWAVSLFQAGIKGSRGPKPAGIIHGAIRELKVLKSFAPTPERLSLLGSAYKRLASISAGEERKKALLSMAEHYKKAHELAYAGGKGKLDPYPLLNWLTAEVLSVWFGAGRREVLAEIEAWCDKAEAAAEEKDKEDPDFWNSLTTSDARLVRALAHKRFDKAGPDIVAGYQRAKERGASPREFHSVIEHLEFLTKMVSEAPKKEKLQAGLKALEELMDKLAAIGGQ
jgi:tetratricopeptide (TPR) repeat protein